MFQCSIDAGRTQPWVEFIPLARVAKVVQGQGVGYRVVSGCTGGVSASYGNGSCNIVLVCAGDLHAADPNIICEQLKFYIYCHIRCGHDEGIGAVALVCYGNLLRLLAALFFQRTRLGAIVVHRCHSNTLNNVASIGRCCDGNGVAHMGGFFVRLSFAAFGCRHTDHIIFQNKRGGYDHIIAGHGERKGLHLHGVACFSPYGDISFIIKHIAFSMFPENSNCIPLRSSGYRFIIFVIFCEIQCSVDRVGILGDGVLLSGPLGSIGRILFRHISGKCRFPAGESIAVLSRISN